MSEKSFRLFNDVWRRPIKYTKTFFGPMFFFINVYEKCIFYQIKYFNNKKNGFVDKGDIVQKGNLISALQESFS